jgi:asparagine synthase (glutamine-hydrolysing)
MFGSETRTLYPHPSFVDDIDAGAVEQYLRYHYIPAPLSIYRCVTKLAPGSCVTVDVGSDPVSLGPQRTFWSLAPILEAPARDITDDAAIARMAELVENAVRKQLVSDVPLGAFLSSGVDSTLVVALQQALSDEPVRTYPISAGARDADEGSDASHTARLLGTKHVERRITDDDVIDRVAHASELFDEPFAEPSQLAISMLAEEARATVTVVLTGDGGDEVSAGYSWYEQFGRGWSIHQRLGRPLRAMTAVGCDLAARAGAAERLPPTLRERLLVDAPRVAAMLRSGSSSEFYASLRSEFPESVDAVRGLRRPPESVVTGTSVPAFEDVQDLALFLDTRSFLPQHPLTKVDRTTMAVGLEARPPLLDRSAMEFAASLPTHMRFRAGQPKWLLQSVARRVLPQELLDRPKRGFVMPLEGWIRGPLDQWMRDRVEPAATSHDILAPDVVRRVLDQHDAGVDRSRVLWSIAMLEDWLRHEAQVRRHAVEGLVES